MTERERGIQLELTGFEMEGETYGFLPSSDLKRWTEEDDPYEKAFRRLPLGRLDGVKALSFLSYIGPAAKDQIFLPYTHTRFDHSFVVGLVIEAIMRQNGFDQEDINVGIVAGLIHDIATPAHGDATKKVDPKALDEEQFWWEALGENGQVFVTQELNIPQKRLDAIIKNQGIIGQVLDIADRITYTMKDLNEIVAVDQNNAWSWVFQNPYLQELHDFTMINPKIGNIYKEVGVDRKKNEVFFNDPRNLGIFLLLRARLHKTLYMNPVSQGRDLFIASLIKRLYSRDGRRPLSPKSLRGMTDENLIEVLQKYYKPEYGDFSQKLYHDLTSWYPYFERFTTKEEAIERIKELKKDKDILIIGMSQCKGFDPGTSYKVTNEKGQTVPFREFDPVIASEIERVMDETKGFFVFFVNISERNSINSFLRKHS
ncbi:MAG: HD domain-containing protein [Candidatus Levybacteria bacterium]|nr:HD domain-containing protein [Candidatus Levybacteria bacterium]